MNNWIATEGSPFVIVEQQYAHQWNGQEDYNAICSVTDYLGKIYIDNHVLLVMGDEPMATRIVNNAGRYTCHTQNERNVVLYGICV